MNSIDSQFDSLRIIAGGGGAASKSSRPALAEALNMAVPEKPKVLIIPTPKRTRKAFDATVPATQRLFSEDFGLQTALLHEFDEDIDPDKAESLINEADVIYTTGGDTLYMMERFREVRIAECLAKKALSGTVVMAGISAGAILPMAWGHSDSLSYRPETTANWHYVRVNGLGLVPFAITPHFNTTHERLGSRAEQFADMLSSERPLQAFGIDNLAAIRVIDGQLTQFQSDPQQNVHIAHRHQNGTIEFTPLLPSDSIKLRTS